MQLILVTAIILIFLLLLKEKRKRVELQKELIEKQLIKQPTADLNNFFNNTSAGCAVCNSTGVITEVNSAYLELLGANREEEVVNQLNLFNDPCINPEFKEMIRKGVSVLGELKYEYKKINDSYMVSNRKGIHYYRFITNYTFTPDGEIEKIFLLLLENTDIHLLLRQNKMFNDLINHASSVSNTGFCSFNLLKKEQMATPQYLKNIGIADEEGIVFTQTSSLTTIHPDDLIWIDNYLAAAKKGVVGAVERKIRILKEGKYGWIKQYFIQQKYEAQNDIITICGVNIDINAEIEIEKELTKAKNKAESSDKLKSAFLANVSHEIRTPLNAIVGFSELMLESESKSELEVYRTIINENSNQLLKLVKDILDLSKIEAGTLEYSWRDVNLNKMIENICYLYSLQENDNHRVKIDAKVMEGECFVHTDPERITQVLKHLTENALKFTEEGSVTIGYEIDTEIYIYVADTGCGIPKEMQQDIFQRFVKLNSFEQGTGLGLSICSNIIQTMGGTIGVNSEVGEGSTFWFRLPITTQKARMYQTNYASICS